MGGERHKNTEKAQAFSGYLFYWGLLTGGGDWGMLSLLYKYVEIFAENWKGNTMCSLQEIFTNREIAIGFWIIIVVFVGLFTKPVQQFIRTTFPIIFCRKFVVFYIIFLSFFCFTVCFLYWVGFWAVGLLKDTVFWVIFVELPLFVRAIEKAKDNHFFTKLIKDNITLIVIAEFLFNFWTFELVTELILIPCAVFIAILYVIASREEKYQKIKRFFDGLYAILGVVIIVYAIINTIKTPEQLFNLATLKSLLLPTLLLFLNLPIVYGLALYSTYEQLFLRVKGNKKEAGKMKRSLLFFAGINLAKVTAIRNNIAQTLVVSLTEKDLKEKLKQLENRLSIQIGENYMKRPHYYIRCCIIGLIVSMLGLIVSNSNVQLKDIVSMNFTLNISRIQEIITYICSTALVLCICLLFYSIGLKKKKNEEISQIKKFALYDLLYLLKRQYTMLKEFPPLDTPIELFSLYITTAYEVKTICDKSMAKYDNILTSWEKETIGYLQLSATSLTRDIGISETEIEQYNAEKFNQYFTKKVEGARQSEDINVYKNTIQNDIAKYSEQIKLCYEEFKHYM